jgi:hypothetical protein
MRAGRAFAYAVGTCGLVGPRGQNRVAPGVVTSAGPGDFAHLCPGCRNERPRQPRRADTFLGAGLTEVQAIKSITNVVDGLSSIAWPAQRGSSRGPCPHLAHKPATFGSQRFGKAVRGAAPFQYAISAGVSVIPGRDSGQRPKVENSESTNPAR